MEKPQVSIGVPVFNGANFLGRSIESLLRQDFSDIEIIISDNASTDHTEAVCREFAASDPRVRYHRNPVNLGAAANYNNVFHLARGEFFKWAAHDDECHPSMIRRCVEVFEQAPPSVVMVYPLGELIDEKGRTLSSTLDRVASSDPRPYRRLASLLWLLNMCDPVFGLYKTEYLKRTRLIGPFIGADYVLMGELAMMGEIREVDEVLFRLRAHSQRSMEAQKNTRGRMAWYNPLASRRKFVLPDWEQMVLEMFRSALGADLPPVEKLKCCATVPAVHYWRRFKAAGGRWKAKVKAGCRTTQSR